MKTKISIAFCVVFIGSWFAAASQAAEPSISELIAALKSGDDAARLRAVDQLGEQGAKAAEAVAPLTGLLKDKSPEIRSHAALSLGEIGEAAKPSAAAIAELLKDSDPSVRRQAIKALHTIRPGPQVMIPICVKLLEDADPGIQVRILNAIAEAGPQAVPGIIEGLKNDKSAYWACLVARDLGPAAKDAIPALIDRLGDPRPEVRREVILALAAMEKDAATANSKLAALLSDEHAAAAATYALGRIGGISADAEAKIKTNTKSADKMLSTASLWVIGKLHPTDTTIRTDVTQQLIGRLGDGDPFVRVAASRALASLPPAPEITVPLWEKAFENADQSTAHHALDAIAQLGSAAVPRLVGALKHEKLRPQVAMILGRMGPDAAPATEALAELVNDKDEDTAHAAAMALGAIGAPAKAAVPKLVAALQQPDQSSRHGAAYALGKIGPAAVAAQPALLSSLKGEDKELALVSAWALTKISPSQDVAGKVVPILTDGLASSQPIFRRGAAEALGSLGANAKSAAPALEKAQKDEDKSVRDAATKALTAVRG